MRCRAARRAIERALEDRWTLDERFALEEHFERCPRCEREYNRARVIEEALLRRPEPPLDRLDLEASVEAIRARTTTMSEPAKLASAGRGLSFQSPLRRVAAAAVLLLALGLSFFVPFGDEESGTPHVSSDPGVATVTPADSRELPNEALGSNPLSEAPSAIALDPVDPERLARVRTEIRDLLASAGESLSPTAGTSEVSEFVQRFDGAVASWADSDWPITRLVTGALDDPEAPVRRAAARYLGQRADRLGVAALTRCFDDRPDSLAVPCGLLDAIARGHAVPVELVQRSEYVELVVERCGASARVVERVVELLLVNRDGDLEQAWLRALPRLGGPGVQALVDLGLRLPRTRARIGTELARFPAQARSVVGARLDEIGNVDLDWAFELCGWLQPADGPDWLAERLLDGTGGVTAFELLSQREGTAALALAIDLWNAGVFGRGGPPVALVQRLQRAPLELELLVTVNLTAAFFQRTDGSDLEVLVDFAVAADEPATLPALIAIAGSSLVEFELRRQAAGAIAELERDPGVADELIRVVQRSSQREVDLTALLLVAIHADRGFDGVRAALPDAPETVLLDIERELNSSELSRRRTAALVRIARSIELALDERGRVTRTTP